MLGGMGRQSFGQHRSDWKDVPAKAEQWMIEVDELVKFVQSSRLRFTHLVVSRVCSTNLPPKEGCLFGMRTSDFQTQTETIAFQLLLFVHLLVVKSCAYEII